MTWQFFIIQIWCLSFVRSQYEPYGENVASGKPANQSTTYGAYSASLGVDGQISTKFSDGTCSHTGEGPTYSWWTVDLVGFYFIKFIRIYQWTDTFVNRLDGSTMYVQLKDNTWKQIYFNSTWPSGVFNVSVELDKPIGEIMLNNSKIQGTAAFICVCELQAFKVIECSPYSIENGRIEVVQYGDSNQTFTYGAQLKVTCHEGYRMSYDEVESNETEITTKCNATGYWTRNLTCSVIDCGQPKNIPDNSTVKTSNGLAGNTSYNATLTVACDEGFNYTLPGNETIRCGVNGSWMSILGLCKVTSCTGIVPPEYGVIVVEMGIEGRWSLNTTVAVVCNTGYSLSGEALIKCLGTGRWTSALGYCSALQQTISDEEQSKTRLLGWIIFGPLCLILLVTNIVTCFRLRRHESFKRKKRNNVPDDVTNAHKVHASDHGLQAKEGFSAYDFVEETDMETIKNKSNGSDNIVMEPYDNLQMDNRAKSEYEKLKLERESSLKTTMKN